MKYTPDCYIEYRAYYMEYWWKKYIGEFDLIVWLRKILSCMQCKNHKNKLFLHVSIVVFLFDWQKHKMFILKLLKELRDILLPCWTLAVNNSVSFNLIGIEYWKILQIWYITVIFRKLIVHQGRKKCLLTMFLHKISILRRPWWHVIMLVRGFWMSWSPLFRIIRNHNSLAMERDRNIQLDDIKDGRDPFPLVEASAKGMKPQFRSWNLRKNFYQGVVESQSFFLQSAFVTTSSSAPWYRYGTQAFQTNKGWFWTGA